MLTNTLFMRRFFFIIFLGIITWFLVAHFRQEAFFGKERLWIPDNYSKAVHVIVDDDGRMFDVMSQARNVDAFLKEQKIGNNENDAVVTHRDDVLHDGKIIVVQHAKHVTLTVAGEKRLMTTYQVHIDDMLAENGIEKGMNDFVLPRDAEIITDKSVVKLVHVDISDQVIEKPIAFTKTVEEDASLSWRKTIVTQKGENGIKKLTYKVFSYDGKEVDRELLSQEITKEPVIEKTTQGTYVAVGKAHTGLGTWYAFTGTLAAASPWLPLGSYVKVTNQSNGKTVVVKINDRGPFGKNRIIDLDKVAFAKIASIGAGIIPMTVEEITN